MKAEPMRTLKISLTPRQAARLQNAVESGAYASNSEVVRDALGLWEQREDMHQLEVERLKRAYREGLKSGPGRVVDPQALLAELKEERRRRA